MRRIAALVGWLAFHVGTAHAQAVTLDGALTRASDSPLVRGDAAALDERTRGDGAITDMTEPRRVVARPGLRTLREDDRGFEGQLQVGGAWNLGDLAGARRGAARAERDALAASVDHATLLARLEAARAWFTLGRAERQLETLDALDALAAELMTHTERAIERGVTTHADRAEASAFQAELALARLASDEARIDAQVELGAALGLAMVEELRPEGGLPPFTLPDPAELEARLARAARVPGVIALELAARAQRTSEAELAAEAAPRVEFDALAYRESPDGLLLFGQIGFEIPLGDRAARARSIARAEAARLDAGAEAARAAWVRLSHRVAHELEHATARAATLRDTLLPSLEALVTARRRQLEVGETTVFVVLDAARRLAEARRELVDAENDLDWARVRAWLLLATLEPAE